MKLADRTIEVHSAGVRSASQFNIAQTSKMFKILSDSLYSDKVMAVIRELSTNANDSHIASGNPNPFRVKLPSAGDPNFSVRDFGTGLSQTDMENLYTTYGASNKNDSNDFVGCLGLGSKSPFAYTKSFTTTSYYNGKQYTYIAAMDDSGVPTLNLLHTIDTNEPNGLEISFAVKQHDFHEFSQKAIRIFHYFKNKPIISGGIGTDFSKEYSNRNIVIDGDGWRVCRLNNNLFPTQYHRIDSGVVAIMGNIAYPVVTSHLIGEDKQETPDHIAKWNRAFNKADIASWKAFVGEIIGQGLYLELDFGIGDLEMDVSREGLQYTKAVVKTLRDKTQDIFLEMKEMFSKKIAAAKTKVEAIATYYTMNDLAGGWGVGATWTDSNNKTHNINSGEDLEYKIKAGKSLYVFNYRSTGYRSRRLVYQTDKIHHETLTGKGYSYWNSQKKNGKMAFFQCDIKTEETAKKIVTRYCNQNDCFAYLMIDTKDYTKSDEGFDDLINDVGSENILMVSDYKDLIKNNNPRKNSTRSSQGSVSSQDAFLIIGNHKDTTALSIGYNDASHMREMSESRLDDMLEEDSIVYVPILRYKTVQNQDIPEVSEIFKNFTTDNAKQLIGNTNIYAIKHNFVEKLTNEGYNLVPFNDFMVDRLKKIKIKKFDTVSQFNGLVEYCRKEYSKDEKRDQYRYYNHGFVDRQILFHILNIFGLDYGSQINNATLIKAIDHCMIMEFFSDTVHRSTFDIERFKANDYFGHMSKLLNDIGINGVNSQLVRETNVMYNGLVQMLTNLYGYDNKYTKHIKTGTTGSVSLPSIENLRKTLKEAVDSNPMLKYIVGSTQVTGNLRELKKDTNPLLQIDDRHGYYGGKSGDWYYQLNDVESFKKQLSSLIK